MAKTKYYLPRTDALKAKWLTAFYQALFGAYATLFGITVAQMNALLEDVDAYNYMILLAEAATKYSLSLTAYKKALNKGVDPGTPPAFPLFVAPLLPPPAVAWGVFTRLIAMVKTIKAHGKYDEVIGKLLGIIGADIIPDFTTVRPNLILALSGLGIKISFRKQGTDSIHLYCKRGAETEYTLLATISKASYIDLRANLVAGQPEIRNYQAWFVVADEVVGLISAVAPFTAG